MVVLRTLESSYNQLIHKYIYNNLLVQIFTPRVQLIIIPINIHNFSKMPKI